MTEQDTFRRLRRPPISRMREIIAAAAVTHSQGDWYSRVLELLQDNNWSAEEYNDSFFSAFCEGKYN